MSNYEDRPERKHTPGPWMAWQDEPEGPWRIEIGMEFEIGYLNEANARLIAAAPDMYEALRENCVSEKRCSDTTCDCLNCMMFRALDKAEGKA